MKTFYKILVAALISATTNNFVWFGLTYFAYLSTKSVISTGVIGGLYMVASALSGIWFGAIVDHNKKKTVMMVSSVITLILFSLAFGFFKLTPGDNFSTIASPSLWIFAVVILAGVIAGNLFSIAIPTLITKLIPANERDKANGLFGTVMGVSFAITSVASGLVLGFLGMTWILAIAIILTVGVLLFLAAVTIPEIATKTDAKNVSEKIDIKGTIAMVSSIPGLFALIFFTMFNNFLGGVFMALMDAYGLSLVSVQTWGILWGFLSFGFIFGGLYIAKRGLGKNPLKTLFRVNIVLWTTCIFFTIQPAIALLFGGILIWMCLVPFVEATEQTIIQKVVPAERQGRVFGFSQSIEQAASPLTAFIIGPIAQLFFIPFMTTGAGVKLIGPWFGVGAGRGIALVFIISGCIGLVVTLVAMRSNAYKLLAKQYAK